MSTSCLLRISYREVAKRVPIDKKNDIGIDRRVLPGIGIF